MFNTYILVIVCIISSQVINKSIQTIPSYINRFVVAHTLAQLPNRHRLSRVILPFFMHHSSVNFCRKVSSEQGAETLVCFENSRLSVVFMFECSIPIRRALGENVDAFEREHHVLTSVSMILRSP
jgi:hypothetical protein